MFAHCSVAPAPETNKSVAPEYLQSIDTTLFALITTVSAGVGTAISQIAGLDHRPVATLVISVAGLDTRDILSNEAVGKVIALVLLVQTKIKRKVVPAKFLGMNAVCFVVPTCEV